jgi:TPR repeat protein
MALAEHYERLGDHRRAAEWYSKASVAGDTRAQLKVADTLLRASTNTSLSGPQRERAREQGTALLRHAAEARNPDAAYRLHTLYSDGVHLPPQSEEAERWLRAAAEANHPDAAFALAARLLNGADPAAALPMLERAGQGGHLEALRRLVAHHLNQAPPAFEAATRWAQRAAQHGDRTLQGEVDQTREVESQRIAAAEREAEDRRMEAEREATEKREQEAVRVAAANREAEELRVATAAAAATPVPTHTPDAAQTEEASMSLVLEDLQPSTPEPSLADVLAEMQAMRGEVVALQKQLAERDALLAERDRHIAALQAEISRDQENRNAAAVAEEARRKNESGLAAFRAGDHAAAFSRFDAAARAGNAQAMNNLATLYINGQGAARSTERAIEFFALAANAGNAQAAANLGNLFARGTDGVQRDPAQAEEWYRRAEMLGHSKAGEYVRALEAQRVAGR